MTRFALISAVAASIACGAQALAHGISVGRTIENRLAVIIENPMPLPLDESTFPGVPGFAEADPGIASLHEAEDDLLPLQQLSEIEFLLTAADPGIQVWNDRGDAPMAVGETFYLGFPEFSEHPVWNIHVGQLGDVKSLTVVLRDRTEIVADSDPIVLEFIAVPEPSTAFLLALGAGLLARRRWREHYRVMSPESKTEPDVVVAVRNLVVRFPAARGGMMTVLDGVDFDVHRGETLVILGGSGSGESTVLNCMIGELDPDAGAIEYRLPGLPVVDITNAERETADALRKRMGILFQSGALFSSMTVAENVALPLREHSHVDPAVIDIVVAMKLQQVHMLPHRDKYPAQLSGGQKKRVGLARATALDPLLLFYDEPSAGLDPVTSSAIDALMMDLSQKMHVTSVVVTHEMDSAFRIADRMIMLDKGRILRAGTRNEFDVIRRAEPRTLHDDADRLLHQFLNGAASGPLTDADGLSLYENLLIGGGRTTILRKSRT